MNSADEITAFAATMGDNIVAFAMAWIGSPNFLSEAITVTVLFIFARAVFKSARWLFRLTSKRRASRTARLFSGEQKHAGHRRAGGRCEFSNGLGRCTNASVEADHFYPYSKGGATSMKNFVASCRAHNRAKSAKIPSSFEKARIEFRRKSYFPTLVSVKVGEWA